MSWEWGLHVSPQGPISLSIAQSRSSEWLRSGSLKLGLVAIVRSPVQGDLEALATPFKKKP